MKQYYVLVLFHIYLFAFLNALPAEKPPNYTNHKNYRLLPPKELCGVNQLEDKILGGNEALLGQFPWIVRLKYKSIAENDNFGCAGSIINERYILTAAHCIVGQSEVSQVRLGEHDARTDPDTSPSDGITADPIVDADVEEIVSNKGYNLDSKQDDIALIRLKKNITFSDYIQPICLPLNGELEEFIKQKYQFTVAGWGLTEKKVTSPVKLATKVPFTNLMICSAVFIQRRREITDKQICAGGEKGIDSCKGDSGGPLQLDRIKPDTEQNYLAGIVSFGNKDCGVQGAPGVYTRVPSYIDWILDNMKPF